MNQTHLTALAEGHNSYMNDAPFVYFGNLPAQSEVDDLYTNPGMCCIARNSAKRDERTKRKRNRKHNEFQICGCNLKFDVRRLINEENIS